MKWQDRPSFTQRSLNLEKLRRAGFCGHSHCWQEGRFGRAVISSLFALEAAMKLEENLNIRIWERAVCFGFLIGVCHKSHLYSPLKIFFFFFEGWVNLARLGNGALSDLTSKAVVWQGRILLECHFSSLHCYFSYAGTVLWGTCAVEEIENPAGKESGLRGGWMGGGNRFHEKW